METILSGVDCNVLPDCLFKNDGTGARSRRRSCYERRTSKFDSVDRVLENFDILGWLSVQNQWLVRLWREEAKQSGRGHNTIFA